MKKWEIGKHVTSRCKLWLKNVARLGSLFVLHFCMKIALNWLSGPKTFWWVAQKDKGTVLSGESQEYRKTVCILFYPSTSTPRSLLWVMFLAAPTTIAFNWEERYELKEWRMFVCEARGRQHGQVVRVRDLKSGILRSIPALTTRICSR